jgi:mRNA-degrading endonuclease RelE of RelBE toxin-antitoxin system
MAMQPERKVIKVGVKEGGGEPPGYKWNVEILDQAFEEAMGFLDEDQYAHLANQIRELARQDDPTHSDAIDIRPVEGFHEIRDKGGVLRKLNVRVFYAVHKPTRAIVVLGTIKKENNGPTPTGDRIRMRRRRRLYLEGRQPES